MVSIVTPKGGKLLELIVNEEGMLEETEVSHNPIDYSILGMGRFQHIIRLNSRAIVHPDVKKEYYSALVSFAEENKAELFQIWDESTKYTESQEWGVFYETTILMYVK